MPLGITGKVLYDVTVKGHAAHGFRPPPGHQCRGGSGQDRRRIG